MTKLALILSVAAAMVFGVLIWQAEASPLSQTVESLAVIKGYSTVQKAGCMFGTHRCRGYQMGLQQVFGSSHAQQEMRLQNVLAPAGTRSILLAADQAAGVKPGR